MHSSCWGIAAALVAVVAQAQTNSTCKVEILKGMTFDLTPLRRGEESIDGVYVADATTMFSVNDTAGAGVGREYLYDFNFCGAVEPTPQCQGKGFTTPRPAFQSDIEQDGFCYALSGTPSFGWQFSEYGELPRTADENLSLPRPYWSKLPFWNNQKH